MAPIMSILGGKHNKINLEFVEKRHGKPGKVREMNCWGWLRTLVIYHYHIFGSSLNCLLNINLML